LKPTHRNEAMSEYSIFTSESVSEGHPDKIADQISDAVLDAMITQDKHARVAVETLVKTGVAIVAGEVTTSAWVDLEQIVRDVICDIGYTSSEVGFDGATCGVINIIGKQSVDIAQGVDRAKPEDQGAGDQGLMFGYASNETDVLMPAPIVFSHRLVERQAEARKSGLLPWLRPDAKSQVTCRYEGGKVVGSDWAMRSTPGASWLAAHHSMRARTRPATSDRIERQQQQTARECGAGAAVRPYGGGVAGASPRVRGRRHLKETQPSADVAVKHPRSPTGKFPGGASGLHGSISIGNSPRRFRTTFSSAP